MILFAVSASVLMALATAQSLCNPDIQYRKDGQCCMLCDPGTRMREDSNCQSPGCEECGENEYQDGYTKDSKCKRQPYCDPNKNFEAPAHMTKKKKNECICKQGFHCSSKDCITCVAHKACGVGEGVYFKGNHTHDIVCVKCQKGTFSNESSRDGVCMKWTECPKGFEMNIEGTDRSDIICVEKRNHTLVICILTGLGAVIVLAVGIYLFQKKARCMKETTKVDGCVECLEPESKRQNENADEPLRTPVENDDCHGISENGNFVTQEFGKGEVLSRQESQIETMCEV